MFDESDRGGEIVADPDRLAAAVEAARAGEACGWNALFERFHPDVHAYALARLGDRAAAEDVSQEVFVAAVTAIKSLRERREPAVQAWFLHICRYKVIDHLRRGSRRQAAVYTLHPAPDPDPTAVAVTRMEADEVRSAMAGLTEDQRDIMVRRFVLDQSLETVATATGRSVGAIKSLQHRALATLKRALGAVETA